MNDGCDRCSAKAVVAYCKPPDGPFLTFCQHHSNEVERGMADRGWIAVTYATV